MAQPRYEGFLPGRYPITAYGDGGFRFAEMSHRGSLLLLPSGVLAVEAASAQDLTSAHLAAIITQAQDIELLLVGTGRALVAFPAAHRAALAEYGIRCEIMQTGSAVRTYNVLLAEDRQVAAVLIAVD